MAVFLPLGINNKDSDWISKILGPWLFVNPEKIRVRRQPAIATTRTMGGNVFYVWPNRPDEVEFEGIFYGLRSYIHEIKLISKSTYTSTEFREVELIYNFRKYRGFITNLQISGSGEEPYMLRYNFTFVSKDAIELATLMLGHLNTLQAETSYLVSAANNAVTAITNGALFLNTAASIYAAVGYIGQGKLGLYQPLIFLYSTAAGLIRIFGLNNKKYSSKPGKLLWQNK